jgi:hypothetical protein
VDSDVKWLVPSRRNGARLVAFPPQLVLRSGGGIGERRIAAHIVFSSVADAMVVSKMTDEGYLWLGVQGSPQEASITLHRF